MEEKTLIDQKKEYLNSYNNVYIKLKSLEDQLQSLRETKEAAKAQVLSDMPKGSKHSDLSDYIVKLEDIINRISNLKQECANKKLDIEKNIADMSDGTESNIIFKRYIEFKTWDQICTEIGYSWRQTHRIHSKALVNFKL